MSVGFSRLKVSGYRRLRSLDLELRPFNVLIGANGVGKSSVLDAVDLLAAGADGTLERTLSDAGGISSVLSAIGAINSIGLGFELPAQSNRRIEYDLRLSASGIGYSISHERLAEVDIGHNGGSTDYIEAEGPRVRYYDSSEKKFIETNREEYRASETALYQAPNLRPYPTRIRAMLGDIQSVYHGLDVSYKGPVRLPQPLQPADTPDTDGSLLLACLYTMRETHRRRFEAVVDALRAAFPTFERIDLPPVAAGRVTLTWTDRMLTKPMYPHQLSEGTLRFLWLATLLQSPKLPPVLMIDEPEVSLHPEMLRLLTELMREASERTQLIVATHSDRLVRFLEPDELVVCDLDEDGGMTAKRGSELNLEAWLKDYTLGELWTMGRLGGRS